MKSHCKNICVDHYFVPKSSQAGAHQFPHAVLILRQCRTAFHPVTAVEVLDAVDELVLGMVDVTADHAVGAMAARLAETGQLDDRSVASALMALTTTERSA